MKSLIVTLAIMLVLPFSLFAADAGVVTGLKGDVFFRAKTGLPYSPLKKGGAIKDGNWIRTGETGWAELTLPDKSRFTLSNNTEFEVTRFLLDNSRREGNFKLLQGKLRASVVKLAGRQSGMTVNSGTAVAGIKGTEFLMLSHGPANVFFGNEGVVAVSGDPKGVNRPLLAGTMTQNTRGFAPAEVTPVEPGTPLAEAKGIFDRVTAAEPPDEWTDSGRIGEIIARWNINRAAYLADSGKYDEALLVLQIALDLSTNADIRSDAHLARGSVYARYLGNPELALAENLLVLEEYPGLPQTETALFNVGQILAESGFTFQARNRFKQYLREYPTGKQRGNVETLLRALDNPEYGR